MTDHIHMLWAGILDASDQRTAMRFFRAQINPVAGKLGTRLQKQPYDHVLREEERAPSAFEQVVEYIARNPERADLVPPDKYHEYRYTGCLVPGYPDLSPWQDDYWEKFWRIYLKLQEEGLIRTYPPNHS
jgi:hypothetical protein